MNRRRSTRVTVRLDCHVVWPQSGGSAAMLTENISRDGMLLRWDHAALPVPRVGDMLIVEVALPEQQGFERRCIRCQATVARVQPDDGGSLAWVGLSVHAMEFRLAQSTGSPMVPAACNGRGGRVF
jgi:hypothetical protein